jgi:hypothetical protein
MRYYLATTSDGTVFKRSSAQRSYVACVAVHCLRRALSPAEIAAASPSIALHHAAEWRGWLNGEWAGRLDLAHANARRNRGGNDRTVYRVEVLHAIEVDAKTFRATQGKR